MLYLWGLRVHGFCTRNFFLHFYEKKTLKSFADIKICTIFVV